MAKKKTLTVDQYYKDKTLSEGIPKSTITWRLRKGIQLPNVRRVDKIHRFYLLEVQA